MARHPNILSVSVIWRGKKYVVEVYSEASLLELGEELQKMTDVKANTIRLFVPQSSTKSSRLLIPFSDEHSSIKLQDAEISEGKPLRMMGVLENEVDQLLKDSQANLRIAGFEEEERRLKQRSSRGPRQSLKLPEGPYIFADFRTLEIPGIEFNPPPSEALKRMHMLAADLGIVAIMNKHRWRVGIMTEMAPEGYVGVSPVCLLGLNKNHGEEISLRLRTDDLKGFRKYDRIKQTLLHELAHMVYSEHDENFYALDKQLNQEASALDWTQSRSHTLANTRFHGHDDLDMDFESESSLPQKLGGESSTKPANARVAAAAAAYHRLADSSKQESDDYKAHGDETNQDEMESDSVDIQGGVTMITTPDIESVTISNQSNFDDTVMRRVGGATKKEVIDPVDLEISENKMAIDTTSLDHTKRVVKTMDEPDPDDTEVINNASEDDRGDHSQSQSQPSIVVARYDHPEECTVGQTPDVSAMSGVTYEPDPDDEELKRLQDPVTMFCERLAKAVKMLQNEVDPSEIVVVQETLFKIIRNASENPNDMKYKRLRKANPVFQRRIANCKAAMDILFMVGFVEEVTTGEIGTAETYLVLKRNDPGLLWLAKSSLETAFARA